MYEYILHPLAQQEYEHSINWYSKRSFKAAANFVTNMESAISAIRLNPHQFRNEYKNFREIGIKKYPFSIIYSIDESIKSVLIMSVFHHKKNPKKKYRK